MTPGENDSKETRGILNLGIEYIHKENNRNKNKVPIILSYWNTENVSACHTF